MYWNLQAEAWHQRGAAHGCSHRRGGGEPRLAASRVPQHWHCRAPDLDQLRELRSPLHLGTARLCPHQGQHQEVRVKVRSVGPCSGEDKTNKNTASGHGTTVLTSDWLGGDQQPAAATELRGRGQRMELRRDRAREAIFKGKSIEFLMTYWHHDYILGAEYFPIPPKYTEE